MYDAGECSAGEHIQAAYKNEVREDAQNFLSTQKFNVTFPQY